MTWYKSLNEFFRERSEKDTFGWSVIVRVCVTLTTVLHQEAGVVPRHADNPIRLMEQNMGQHTPMAVHDYDLSVCSTEQHLGREPQVLLRILKKKKGRSREEGNGKDSQK